MEEEGSWRGRGHGGGGVMEGEGRINEEGSIQTHSNSV